MAKDSPAPPPAPIPACPAPSVGGLAGLQEIIALDAPHGPAAERLAFLANTGLAPAAGLPFEPADVAALVDKFLAEKPRDDRAWLVAKTSKPA